MGYTKVHSDGCVCWVPLLLDSRTEDLSCLEAAGAPFLSQVHEATNVLSRRLVCGFWLLTVSALGQTSQLPPLQCDYVCATRI
jgi:hypothetical protein